MTSIPVRHDPIKRILDILFSFLILICSAPLMAVLVLLVKISSPGPIFFGSTRLGQGGKVITCWKFRSMYSNAEQRLAQILASDLVCREEWQRFQKLKKDPRITPIGQFLRRTSLDEWPQFWNVLKGDLSVVGPRPLVLMGPPEQFSIEIRAVYGKSAETILSVKPGLTGVWQISGRSNLSLEERVSLEEHYVRTRTLFRDMILFFKTVPVLLFSRGAY